MSTAEKSGFRQEQQRPETATKNWTRFIVPNIIIPKNEIIIMYDRSVLPPYGVTKIPKLPIQNTELWSNSFIYVDFLLLD
jgi:hypothetical protein